MDHGIVIPLRIRSGLIFLKRVSEVCRPMSWPISKYFITAAIVVLVSEFAKRSDKLGCLIA